MVVTFSLPSTGQSTDNFLCVNSDSCMRLTLTVFYHCCCSSYFPVWAVNTEMLGKLMEASNKFVQNLLDLAKEVGEYNQCQKDKMKSNVSVCACICPVHL